MDPHLLDAAKTEATLKQFFLKAADMPGDGSNMSQPDRNLKGLGIGSTIDETF